MPKKENMPERIKQALDISVKAQDILHRVWGEELLVVRENFKLLEEERDFLKKLGEMEEELKSMLTEEKMLDEAVKKRSSELIRQLCDDLKLKIGKIKRDLETIRNREHTAEEKHASEKKFLEEEEKGIAQIEEIFSSLGELEGKIESLAEPFISKAKTRNLKL